MAKEPVHGGAIIGCPEGRVWGGGEGHRRREGISRETFYRWRRKYGGMEWGTPVA